MLSVKFFIMIKRLFILLLIITCSLHAKAEEDHIFQLPCEFYARKQYSNSKGLSFETRLYRQNNLIRIELVDDVAGGAYTILDASNKLIHLIYPNQKQFITIPYPGPSSNKDVIDDMFLYLSPQIKIFAVDNDVSTDLYQFNIDDENYELLLQRNGLPLRLTMTKGDLKPSVAWLEIVVKEIDSNLLKVPEEYSLLPLLPQD